MVKSLFSTNTQNTIQPFNKEEEVVKKKLGPYTKRQARSAAEIGVLGGYTEFEAGAYLPDLEDTITTALEVGLKGKRLG